MTIRGQSLYSQMTNDKSKVAAMRNKTMAELDRARRTVEQLLKEQAQTLRTCATAVLSSFGGQQNLPIQLVKLRERVSSLLTRRDALQKAIDENMEQAQGRLDALVPRYHEADQKFNTLDAQRKGMIENAMKDLAASQAYQSLATQERLAAEQAARADEKADHAEEDRDRKTPEYERDPLFAYLVRQRYYDGGRDRRGFIGAMDRWVAKLCAFEQHYPNYVRLAQIPQVLREHAQACEAEHAQKTQAVQMAEQEARDTPEIRKVVKDTIIAQVERDALKKNVQKEHDTLEALRAQNREILSGQDQDSIQALNTLTEALASFSEKERVSVADLTPDTSDDEVVRNIGIIQRNLNEAREKTQALGRELQNQEATLDRITQACSKFQRKSYTSDDFRFSSMSQAETLWVSYMMGNLSQDSLFSEFRTKHVDPPPVYYPSSSSSSSSSSSDSFGGGGFSSGGGFGGGGFSTTDSF